MHGYHACCAWREARFTSTAVAEKEVSTCCATQSSMCAPEQVCTLPVPVGATYDDLLSAVEDVVLGPEDGRWAKVN